MKFKNKKITDQIQLRRGFLLVLTENSSVKVLILEMYNWKNQLYESKLKMITEKNQLLSQNLFVITDGVQLKFYFLNL